MNERYIDNGKVARNIIALDIKYRRLDRSGIERLLSDPVIAAGLSDGSYDKKRPKQDWNRSYLDELSYVAIAECFNRDYLLYLDEVAEYVAKNVNYKKIILAGFAIILVIVAGVVVCKYILKL